jgi:hypothetical protein
MYIHELFHCFQPVFTDGKSSGLEYNPDTNYAVYSELEADALNLAYHERDLERAKEFAKDFLCARELKRRSMTPEQAAQESGAELKEGTAVYAETRALEILRGGYKAGLTDDPWYRGFQSSGLLLDTYNQQLHRRKALTFESLAKSYYTPHGIN